ARTGQLIFRCQQPRKTNTAAPAKLAAMRLRGQIQRDFLVVSITCHILVLCKPQHKPNATWRQCTLRLGRTSFRFSALRKSMSNPVQLSCPWEYCHRAKRQVTLEVTIRWPGQIWLKGVAGRQTGQLTCDWRWTTLGGRRSGVRCKSGDLYGYESEPSWTEVNR